MATLINIPDDVEQATMEGADAAKNERPMQPPSEQYCLDTPEYDAWIVGWLAKTNGWVIEF